MADHELFTVAEVAGRLKVHPETIRDWLRTGRLKGIRLGGTKTGWRIPESEIRRILQDGDGAPSTSSS
ncbi:MAG: helix-turn-helix domain-containing protein [Acidobacteria bacterium]|nr:helix-turn-helix domain-containing protein [Acidobacteriota bacterium]